MLQIKNICKEYNVGGIVTKALDNVSLNLRDNEFVAILGPSGSGKTTLLNVIGGLDRYDSGDLIINSISTKRYNDRDWDSYRNHTVGFVFQSYNLIPHQTVLANVELALTISGIGKNERKKRAIEALEKVGLKDHINKKPNQMSGGQMQRVAIARALVNNPDILLADEPTGALDSDTSVQVMELLKEVAKDRLVVMVTHNPELAEEYATRIVRVKDGVINDDSNPFDVEKEKLSPPKHQNMGKSSMSPKTALSLSFNNLLTKKARTLLTSFAGSIGIIGIALILALSNGVNLYITTLEEDTLSEYPIQISKSEVDFTSMMAADQAMLLEATSEKEAEVREFKMLNSMLTESNENDLKSLKEYFESGTSDIDSYTNAVEYRYNVTPNIFRMIAEDDYRQINPDKTLTSAAGTVSEMTAMMLTMTSSHFSPLPENEDLYINQYDVMAGKWPENYNECVVVLLPDGGVSDLTLYAIGLKDITELDDILKTYAEKGEANISTDSSSYNYNDFLDIEFKLVDPTSLYQYDKEYDIYVNKSDDEEYMLKQVKNGETLKIVGVVQPSDNSNAAMLMSGIGYTSSLTSHIIEVAQKSEIAKKQRENPDINIFTGNKFSEDNASFDMESLFKFDENALDMAALSGNLDMSSMFSGVDMSSMMGEMDLSSALENMDMSQLLGDVDMSQVISNVDMSQLLKDIDFSEIMDGVDLEEAINNIDVKAIIESIDFSSIEIPVSQEELKKLFDDLLNSYIDQLEGADPTFEGFYSFVQSEAGQKIINDSLGDIVDINSALSQLKDEITAVVQKAVSDELKEALAPVIEQISINLTKTLSEQLSPVIAQASKQFMSAIAGAIGEQISTSIEQMMGAVMGQMGSQISNALSSQMTSLMSSIQKALSDSFSTSMDGDSLKELMGSMMNPTAASFEEVLATLNYAEFDDPYTLLIYPKDFESKESIVQILDDYNTKMEQNNEPDKVITYTDVVGTLMSSVTTIINVVSYVLIAFVAVSLIVSSIMIGIITYISVLERTKEIGILRAVGASKKNISQVFNAETFIIGLCSGLMGVGVSLLTLIPANALIHHLTGINTINAVLPPVAAIILIILSVILTLIGGLIPSKKAAKKDPVTALRSE